MKRSEMLRIIWEAINELEDADHILKHLEDAGMKPPCSEVGQHCSGCGYDVWEPENEKE